MKQTITRLLDLIDRLRNWAAPRPALRRMITGYMLSQAVYAAAALGLADLLADGPRTAAELALATGADPGRLARLLRALASEGVFAEVESGRFRLTRMAGYLRDDWPGSLRPMALTYGAGFYWQPWGQLLHSIRSGESAFERIFGADIWSYFDQHLEEARLFDEAMAVATAQAAQAVIAAYPFSAFRTVMDVGCGRGPLLVEILKDTPGLCGLLFDLPRPLADARQRVARAGLSDRCQVVAGDFFAAIPSGADAYLLKNVIHDWDDGPARQILANCRAALPRDGRVLLVEMVIPPGNRPFLGKILDLDQMVQTNARERTEAEYRELLRGAGLDLARVVPTPSVLSILECVPAREDL